MEGEFITKYGVFRYRLKSRSEVSISNQPEEGFDGANAVIRGVPYGVFVALELKENRWVVVHQRIWRNDFGAAQGKPKGRGVEELIQGEVVKAWSGLYTPLMGTTAQVEYLERRLKLANNFVKEAEANLQKELAKFNSVKVELEETKAILKGMVR